MSSKVEATLPATRRSRKSVGASPKRRAGDKENATVDLGNTMAASRKKSRSKSMGPGSMDALKSGSGNRRASLAIPSRPPPRSILKPTTPLLPDIPQYKSKKPEDGPEASSAAASFNPFDGDDNFGTKIALRTEEEQHAAARAREERERAQLEKENNDRREARRKSLANRRVSFAAEATLHTFHEMEFVQDSTTSTDSTRRASSVASRTAAPEPQDGPVLEVSAPQSPPSDEEDKPADDFGSTQGGLQRNRRRSSGMFSDADDVTVASTMYSSDSEHGDEVQSVQGDIMSGSDNSDDEDGTLMTVDAEEMTMASMVSGRSRMSIESSPDLDENLRLAAQHATTHRAEDDDEEIIAGFAGWGKKNQSAQKARDDDQEREPQSHPNDGSDMEMDMDMDMDLDMEMTGAVGGILKPSHSSPEKGDETNMSMDMSMDVTRVYGAIIPQSNKAARRKSVKPSTQHFDESTSYGDQTMDLTMAVGGIQHGRISDGSHTDTEGNEDMSMELTMAVGDIVSNNLRKSIFSNRQSTGAHQDNNGEAMEMTGGVGKPGTAQADDGEDQTIGMDMTMAVGGIIKPALMSQARSAAKKVMEEEADKPDASVTTSLEIKSPTRRSSSRLVQDKGDSSLAAFTGKGLRRSPSRSASPPKSPVRLVSSPVRLASSPLKSPSPSPARKPAAPASPTLTRAQAKSTVSMLGSRSSSPMRLTSPAGRTTPRSSTRSKTPQSSVFQHDPATGAATPLVILTPQRWTPQPRNLSGLGADRPGLGSPRVAEILERRHSIGDATPDFVPGRRAVAFADPRVMGQEIEREQQAEEEREEHSPADKDITQNLIELIQGLSPKKNPLKGRKSLHVGSARGLLGKRPFELEDDDEGDSEVQDGVKRLKNHQGSPVKNIRLSAPPSKDETMTGRKTRSGSRADGDTITATINLSPQKPSSPIRRGLFPMFDTNETTATGFESSPVRNYDFEEGDEDRIHLQDFLNLTSIRFMELTTTKRRHTVAPRLSRDGPVHDRKDDLSLERCVVAGACTVPMLELFQHSCRELKKYISEGRRIVREIETETFEENPPLFREYMSATPEIKMLMDNQFKNVKTHARFLSKAMWYEWRMKLQDGLKEGLVKIGEDMGSDARSLDKQQELLSSVLPALVQHLEELEEQHGNLEAAAQELASSNPEELQGARAELVATENEVEEKIQKIAELRRQLEESEASFQTVTQQKQECLEEIKEAEKIREECRGWTSTEINTLKGRVCKMEKQHGWAITGIAGNTISMAYQGEIELVFDVTAFQPNSEPSSAVDLWYVGASRERNPIPATPEKDFFLQCIRDVVRGLPQSQMKPSAMLGVVSAAWDKANAVAKHVRLLNVVFPTQVSKTSDSSISITSTLLLAPLKTKVEIAFGLVHSQPGGQQVEVAVAPHARVVYGEQFNASKMNEFLATRIGTQVVVDNASGAGQQMASWGDVVGELHAKLLAKGRK